MWTACLVEVGLDERDRSQSSRQACVISIVMSGSVIFVQPRRGGGSSAMSGHRSSSATLSGNWVLEDGSVT